jgi:riboflavin synthase
MFTGIVEELGSVTALEDQGDAVRLTIAATTVLEDVKHGDSIAVDGCCLTVAATGPGTWTADLMRETLERTSLRGVRPGELVNLERAVTPQTRLGGHLVQGHVDAVGRILRREPSQHWDLVTIALPARLSRYVVEKGSIAVDGVSLTVVDTGPATGGPADRTDAAGEAAGGAGHWLSVSLIPETLARTTLGRKRAGDLVNLETDIIAKHVEKLLGER